MGEFQINTNRPEELRKLFGDPERRLSVEAEVELAGEEVAYLTECAEDVLRPIVWRRVLGRNYSVALISGVEFRQYGPQVDLAVAEGAAELRAGLVGSTYRASFEMPPVGQLQVLQSAVLEVVFETYAPDVIGVIDYHSSSRTYERENLGGVNLNLDAITEQRKGHLLYNWREKYRNIKTELASQYVREAIAARAGVAMGSDLSATLMELFKIFFPDKKYEGIVARPDGSIGFPVSLTSGQTHDIDDLSSGEKELVYGYLRLRDSAPRNSIILIDEPELHLNPRLLQGFPDFYHAHLGRALNNQIWLVTHSDAILRQAVGKADFSVYHMSPATSVVAGENQASVVLANDDVERVVLAMVGDLAAYKPRAKVVIFEGGGDSEVDVMIVGRLFPLLAQKMNFVPGGSKRRVRDLHSVLADAATRAGLTERFFAIVDRDREDLVFPAGASSVKRWERYHIENYLLDAPSIRSAILATLGRDLFLRDEEVMSALKDCATSLVDRLILERLQSEINEGLLREINIGAPPDTKAPAQDLRPSIAGSIERIRQKGETFGSDVWLHEREAVHRNALEVALQSDAWCAEFPGRRILSVFVGKFVPGASYEVFRNVIVDKMVEGKVQPAGIRIVLQEIEAA